MNKTVYLWLFTILFMIFYISCSFGKNTDSNNQSVSIKDSINEYGKRIRTYGDDSIYAFLPDGTLRYILYLKDSNLVRKKLFCEGILEYIEYNPVLSKDSLSNEYYYSNGVIKSRIFLKDTIIITDSNPISCFALSESFYSDGKIRETGYMGTFSGQNISVGLWKYYDQNGKIIKSKNYIYPKQKDGTTTQTVFTYIIESEYYDNGNPKWEKQYKNYVFYESDEESKEPIGLWKFYNEKKKIIKTEKH